MGKIILDRMKFGISAIIGLILTFIGTYFYPQIFYVGSFIQLSMIQFIVMTIVGISFGAAGYSFYRLFSK